MLLYGQDIASTDHSGQTALHAAATSESREIIELLLKAGADVNWRDKNVYLIYFY